MTELFIHYNETRIGGIPESDEEWCSYSDTIIDFDIIKVCLERDKTQWLTEVKSVDFTPVKGENVYIVVVRYTDGCTFGTTRGNWEIREICKTPIEATYIRDWVLRNKKEPSPDKRDNDFTWESWWGYFADFEDCYIETFTVE